MSKRKGIDRYLMDQEDCKEFQKRQNRENIEIERLNKILIDNAIKERQLYSQNKIYLLLQENNIKENNDGDDYNEEDNDEEDSQELYLQIRPIN